MKKLFVLSLLFVSIAGYSQNPGEYYYTAGGGSAQASWTVGNLLYYFDLGSSPATNAMHQLYRTDGTAAGTAQLTSFPNGANIGFKFSRFDCQTASDNIFYFIIHKGSYSHQYALWRSDGTVAGTYEIDLSGHYNSSGDILMETIVSNSNYTFFAINRTPTVSNPNAGVEVYSINSAGQITFLKQATNSGGFNNWVMGRFTIFKNRLVSSALGDISLPPGHASNSIIFFQSDGTSAGTTNLGSSMPPVTWADYTNPAGTDLNFKMIPCSDQFILLMVGTKLAKFSGGPGNSIGPLESFYNLGGTGRLQTYLYNGDFSFSGNRTWFSNNSVNNTLFIFGLNPETGQEIWKTDGTEEGTQIVKDLYPGTTSGTFFNYGFSINNKFVFRGQDGTSAGLFITDGTVVGTYFAKNALPTDVRYIDNRAYFRTSTIPVSLWQTDGTINGTVKISPDDLDIQGNVFGNAGADMIYMSRRQTAPFVYDPISLVKLRTDYRTWYGGTGTNWADASNWESNAVPLTTENILIPGQVNNYPVISSDATINSLWLCVGTITANNNSILNITGDITVSTNTSVMGNGSIQFSGNNTHTFSGKGTIAVLLTLQEGNVISQGGKKIIPQLNFTGSSKFLLGNNDLQINQSISGYANDRYFVTNGNGRLLLPAIGTAASSTNALYPVGSNINSYTPVSITNSGTSYQWNVRVGDNAFDSYNTTYPETPTSSAVTNNAIDKTWFINQQGGAGVINPSLTFQWNSLDELPGFYRADMKAGRYNNGWIYSANGAAGGSNPYTFTYNNVPGFSPFTLSSNAVLVTYYADADSDTYGDPNNSMQATFPPPGYVIDNTDCNDAISSVHPGATEICNGIDDDCDGHVDEGTQTTFYQDADGDAYGNATQTTQACTAPEGYVSNSTDCNDANAAVYPGATEICNGIDDDCDGQVDEVTQTTFYQDADGDSYGNSTQTTQACTAPEGYVSNSTDCNDANAAVHPGATEICNGIDDDCDGIIDEGFPIPVITGSNIAVTEGNSGTSNATFTLNLSFSFCQPVMVSYTMSDSSATSSQDYVAVSGTVTFPAGTTSRTITVPVIGDLLDENNELFKLQLSNPVNATVGFNFITCTIQDNDPEPTGSINDVTVYENAGQALLTVSLSAPSSKPVRVKYRTINGTAVQPQDYVRINNGDVTIPAGSSSIIIAVAINYNAAVEPTEYFDVEIHNLQNASIADGIGRISILDGNTPIASRSAEPIHTGKNKSAEFVSKNLKAIVFPNPHRGNFILRIESPEDGIASIQLLSADGRLITVKNVMLHKGNSNTMSFSDMSEAVLFYRIIIGKYIANGKIIGPN